MNTIDCCWLIFFFSNLFSAMWIWWMRSVLPVCEWDNHNRRWRLVSDIETSYAVRLAVQWYFFVIDWVLSADDVRHGTDRSYVNQVTRTLFINHLILTLLFWSSYRTNHLQWWSAFYFRIEPDFKIIHATFQLNHRTIQCTNEVQWIILHVKTGLLDIRLGQDDNSNNEKHPCPGLFETCCLLRSEKPIIPAETKVNIGCGIRNTDGVGFRITGDKDGEAQFGEFPWTVAILKVNRLSVIVASIRDLFRLDFFFSFGFYVVKIMVAYFKGRKGIGWSNFKCLRVRWFHHWTRFADQISVFNFHAHFNQKSLNFIT